MAHGNVLTTFGSGCGDGDGGTEVQVWEVGGHTKGHVAFYLPKEKVLFSGDALFALDCGRMFEEGARAVSGEFGEDEDFAG